MSDFAPFLDASPLFTTLNRTHWMRSWLYEDFSSAKIFL